MRHLQNKYISLIIPAYNEEMRIGKTLQDVHSYLSENYPKFEIIVVDDGSNDGTSDTIFNFMEKSKNVQLVKNETNRGKGYSVKKGVLTSSGEIVVFSDADQSVPIYELPKFINLIKEGTDIVIASRAFPNSSVLRRQAIWRQTMGKVFNIFVRMAVFRGIKDTQCGFKCFKRESALDLFGRQKINGFAFDVEILYLARSRGYSIEQIPVTWINSPKSKVDPLYDSIAMLKDLFAIKHLHRGEV